MSIVDLYFYEELSRTVGHEIGSQWLKSKFGVGMRKRKSNSARLFGPFSGCRTPHTSNPSSPRSVASAADFGSHIDKTYSGSKISTWRSDTFLVKASNAQHSVQLKTELECQDEDQNASHSSSKLCPSSETETLKNEPIFANVAHTVLD